MIKHGATRAVFLIGGWAIKIPSFRYGQRYFVYGCLGNILERDHWKIQGHPQLAPVYFCFPLGLFLVMKRYRDLVIRRLTEDEKNTLPFTNFDDNGHNFAYEDGKLVLFDYGNVNFFYSLPTDYDK